MRKMVSLLFPFAMLFALSACGQSAVAEKQEEVQPAVQKTDEQLETSQNGAEMEEQETERQMGTEMEVEPSEYVMAEAGEQEEDMGTETLVVYFSCTGTTEVVAEYVTEILNADLYEIVAEDPYTEEDLAYYTNGRADQEQNNPDVRPAISGSVENMDEYDTIFLGYAGGIIGLNQEKPINQGFALV